MSNPRRPARARYPSPRRAGEWAWEPRRTPAPRLAPRIRRIHRTSVPETLTLAFSDAGPATTQLPPAQGVHHIVADSCSADGLSASQTTNMLVLPYIVHAGVLARINDSGVSIVQSHTAGYDGVAAALPPVISFCNAAGVHEAASGT